MDNDISGFIKDMRSMINEVRQEIRNAEKAFKEIGAEEAANAQKLSDKEYAEYENLRVKRMFADAVNEFYASYTPIKYKRKYSLYDLLDYAVDENGEIISNESGYMDLFDRSQITPTREGYDTLFDTVFIKGYHGGATWINGDAEEKWGRHPNPGVAYYRKPGFAVTEDGESVWHMWGSWGRPAVKSYSAYNIFIDKLESYMSDEAEVIRDGIEDKYFDIAEENILARMSKLGF